MIRKVQNLIYQPRSYQADTVRSVFLSKTELYPFKYRWSILSHKEQKQKNPVQQKKRKIMRCETEIVETHWKRRVRYMYCIPWPQHLKLRNKGRESWTTHRRKGVKQRWNHHKTETVLIYHVHRVSTKMWNTNSTLLFRIYYQATEKSLSYSGCCRLQYLHSPGQCSETTK